MITKIIRLILDILLIIAFLLLMDPRSFYGLTFHEIAGLVICLFFILHMIFNWKFIKIATIRLFRKLPAKTRLRYILDWILLIGVILIIVSGIYIARIIDFSWLGIGRGNQMYWRLMHTSVSMIVLVAFGIHTGLNWKWVIGIFRKS